MAQLLSAASGKAFTMDTVQVPIDAGAPAGIGGRISLVEFMAWLDRELAQA